MDAVYVRNSGCMFSMQELLPLMEINEREILARRIYDELIMAILRVLSRLDLSVTRLSDLQQVLAAYSVCLCRRWLMYKYNLFEGMNEWDF